MMSESQDLSACIKLRQVEEQQELMDLAAHLT